MEPGAADSALVTLVGTDVLRRYLACCEMLIAAEPSWHQSVGKASVDDRWHEARDRAVGALRDLQGADLARIGAAIVELRLAAEPPWPT